PVGAAAGLAARIFPIVFSTAAMLPSDSARTSSRFPSGGRSGARRALLALAAVGRTLEQLGEASVRAEQVLERVAIQHVQECGERVAEHSLQYACRCDRAADGLRA